MIRALATGKDGRPLMLLGITEQNIARMQKGEPIVFDASAVGFEGTIVIMAGGTEQSIADRLTSSGIAIPGDVDMNPLPPVKPDDPNYPFPYVVVERNDGRIILRFEKGVPDTLVFHTRRYVDPMLKKLEHNERTRHLVEEAVREMLMGFAQDGTVLRSGTVEGERYWVFHG